MAHLISLTLQRKARLNLFKCVITMASACHSISGSYPSDNERGTVLEIKHEPSASFFLLRYSLNHPQVSTSVIISLATLYWI
jgi:hypothetical protein